MKQCCGGTSDEERCREELRERVGEVNALYRVADAIEKHRITHLFLPPTVLYMTLALPDMVSRFGVKVRSTRLTLGVGTRIAERFGIGRCVVAADETPGTAVARLGAEVVDVPVRFA